MLRPPSSHLFAPSSAQPEGDHVLLRYLGTAGFVLSHAQHTVVLDPFVSRPGLLATGFRPLRANAERIRQVIPHADDVLVGHAHHDHVLDAPTLCRQTGARFIGGPDACHVARAAGLPEDQIRETRGQELIEAGSAHIRGLPSTHGKVYFGRVTLPGSIPAPPPWPPRVWHLRHGLVLNWHVQLGGLRFVHIDSADFHGREFEGLRADVLCLCAIGRQNRPNYVSEAVRLLQPKIVIPCHWDWFFSPWGHPMPCLPGVDLPGMIGEITDAGCNAVVLRQNQELHLPCGLMHM